VRHQQADGLQHPGWRVSGFAFHWSFIEAETADALRGPGQVEELVVHRLARRLHLDTAQRQQLEKVAERTRTEISQVMSDVKPKIEAIVEQGLEAGQDLHLDERETRRLIDAQLRDVGWEADTVHLSYRAGARPEVKINLSFPFFIDWLGNLSWLLAASGT